MGSSLRPILLFLGVPPPWGGGEIRAAAMARFFAGRPGYLVRTYSRSGGNKKTQGRATAGNIGFGLAYWIRGALLLLRHRPAVLYLSLPKNLGAFLRAVPLIAWAKALNCRVCGELAGARFLFLAQPGWGRRIGLRALRWLDSLRFLGAGVAAAHEEYRFRRPVVFPNGIACPAFPVDYAGRARGRPLELLFVGALNRSKGVASLVRAVAECRRAGCTVHLTLVGEWGEKGFREEIERLLAEMNLRGLVTVAGAVTGEDKWDFFRRAALLVHPTEWDGQPLTILEAMAMGLGVIATRVGAIPDTMEDGLNGILLSDSSPGAIADAIRAYADRPDGLEKVMRANHARYEKEYTVETYLNHVESWLEGVRSPPAPPAGAFV